MPNDRDSERYLRFADRCSRTADAVAGTPFEKPWRIMAEQWIALAVISQAHETEQSLQSN